MTLFHPIRLFAGCATLALVAPMLATASKPAPAVAAPTMPMQLSLAVTQQGLSINVNR